MKPIIYLTTIIVFLFCIFIFLTIMFAISLLDKHSTYNIQSNLFTGSAILLLVITALVAILTRLILIYN